MLMILLGVAAILLGIVGHLRHLQSAHQSTQHLPHYNNSARAREIKLGTSRTELVDSLGDPIGEDNGWLLFDPSPNGRTIRVKLDVAGRVEAIDPGVD